MSSPASVPTCSVPDCGAPATRGTPARPLCAPHAWIEDERSDAKRYEIVEHHFDLRGLPEGKVRRWSVHRGTTTSRRRTIERLAAERRCGEIPETLSEWSVGPERVAGQGMDEMLARQGVEIDVEVTP